MSLKDFQNQNEMLCSPTLWLFLHQQNMIKASHSTEKQQKLVKLLEQDKTTLEHEINGYKQEAQKQRKIIQQLEKERDRHINETSSLTQKAGYAEDLASWISLFVLIFILQYV